MTATDWNEIFEAMIRHAHEMLAATKSEPATVMLDELEEHSAVGFYDLRSLCLEAPDELADAGLVYDDEHRLLRRAGPPKPESTDDP